jgi:hypothetical protein
MMAEQAEATTDICVAKGDAYRTLPVLLSEARERAAFAGRRIRVRIIKCPVTSMEIPNHATLRTEVAP